jgi:hypothetical protein
MKRIDILRGQTRESSTAGRDPDRTSSITRRSFFGLGAMFAGGAAAAGMTNTSQDPLRENRTEASAEPTPHQRTYYDKAKF